MKAKKGFTLIELMIVIAIIGILAAVAIPKFADLINKSKEGTTKGNLSAVRGALTIYYGDADGIYPIDSGATADVSHDFTSTFGDVMTPTYLKSIPRCFTIKHGNSYTVNSGSMTAQDNGTWGYGGGLNDTSGDVQWGDFFVNCTENDSKGTVWSKY